METSNYLQLQKELEKSKADNMLKMVFWANMSHEIRTPINSIVGFARLMAETNDKEEKEEYLEIVEENNILLSQMINDVLVVSQLETNALQINKTNFNVSSVLEDVFQSAKVRSKNDMIQIQLGDIDALSKLTFHSDRVRINQVLTNFVNNALKYTIEGSICIGCDLSKDGKELHFYVKDTGKGISEERQKEIFERYVQFKGTENGFGLGLSISKQLVQMLGGKIGVQSEVGKGSTFWFDLPYMPGVDEPMQATEKEDLKEESTGPLPLLLIAEDDISNYRLAELVLRKHFNIIHAWDGAEAIELYKEKQPALILMDINMPTMNGYQAFDKIKSLNPEVPIIAVTAYAMANEEKFIMDAGFDGYVSKPIDITTFQKKISKFLK